VVRFKFKWFVPIIINAGTLREEKDHWLPIPPKGLYRHFRRLKV
jgi:hypothetical protein